MCVSRFSDRGHCPSFGSSSLKRFCTEQGQSCCRGQLKCDDTRAETRFRLSAKRTSPFKSVGASVQSTAGSRGVRITGSNAVYTMFRGSVKVLATHSIRQFPLHFPSRASPCALTFQLESTSCISILVLWCYFFTRFSHQSFPGIKHIFDLSVIHVRALKYNSCHKTNRCLHVKIMFLLTICRTSDMFRSILIIFSELLNISKAYIKTWLDY